MMASPYSTMPSMATEPGFAYCPALNQKAADKKAAVRAASLQLRVRLYQ
jgi:hypothetical protein